MMGGGDGSFDTNPSLVRDTVELERSSHRRDGGLHSSNHRDDGRHVTMVEHNVVDDNEDEEEDHTVDSSPSEESTVAPSFFIIPCREMTPSSVRQRQKHHQLLDDNNNCVLSAASSLESDYVGCRPYRRDKIVTEIDNANIRGGEGHAAVLRALKNAGVLIFIVDSKVSSSISAIMESVRNVIFHTCQVQKETPSRKGLESLDNADDEQCCTILCGEVPDPDQKVICDVFSHQNQRCLLYRDPDGRLFNLTLVSHTAALAGHWEVLLQSFSVLQAVSLLVILMRAFPCATTEEESIILQFFLPAYTALILGLIFSEEISLSWTNVAMFVRGLPSISAYEIVTGVESDWLRKSVLLCLAVASVTTGNPQRICTFMGISMTCCILLANLGSRSWKFMGWKPTLSGDMCTDGCTGAMGIGFLEPVLAYCLAVLTGICFPYLGHKQIEAGGNVAMESVIRIAVVVAAVFYISDHDEVQKFLVVGSENCNQAYVNVAVGIWWTLSLMACLYVLSKKEAAVYLPDYKEPLLVRDEASPVGFKVPHLPDFPFDPTYGEKGSQCFSLRVCFLVGVFIASGIGAVMIYFGVSDIDDEFLSAGS